MKTVIVILFIVSMLILLYSIFCIVRFFQWRKRANAEHFYNKQGQEVSKAEMEAEMEVELEGMTTQGMSTKGIFNHDEYDNQFD